MKQTHTTTQDHLEAYDPIDLRGDEFNTDYWRDHHLRADYPNPQYTYEDYEPAYRYGQRAYLNKESGVFDDNEHALAEGWDQFKERSRLTWEEAKEAVRTVWHRMEEAMPGDADGDGR